MHDVITVCAGEDLLNLELCIESLRKNLNFNKCYVITNDTKYVKSRGIDVIAVDENDIISDISELRKIDFPHSKERFGWYLQQFLKCEFSRSKFCNGDYLIWDSDTILLKPIQFVSNDCYILTRGREKLHQPYVNTYQSLLNIEKICSFSLISQHLYVDRKIMVEMIQRIEKEFNNKFSYAVLENIKGDNISLFSEYETYGNFLIHKKMKHEIIERKWFRHASSVVGMHTNLGRLSSLFPDCDYVALEKSDASGFARLKGLVRFLEYKLLKK